MTNLLKRCNKIWTKVSNSINKLCDSYLVCNEKYVRYKIQSHEVEVNTFSQL